SSRRRHTRFSRDWSSDVCSSDLKAKNYKIGLATNSPNRIIPAVLKKLDILHLFDTVSSAEFEDNGKPDPAIYLTTAAKLKVAARSEERRVGKERRARR